VQTQKNVNGVVVFLKFRDNFHLYAIATIVFWSLAYVLTRLSLHYFSAFSLGFLRYFVASCTLLMMVLITKMKMPQKSDVKWFFAAGAFGFFLYMLTFNKGCETVTAATSSVIIAVVPVITALLARVFYQEKLSVFQWVAIAIEFSGVILLTMMNHAFTFNHGVIWLFLAAIALSAYNLFQRKLTRTYTGLQVSAYSIFAGTVMLAMFLPDSIKEVQGAPSIQLVYLVILGVFSSALAYAAWAQAFKKAKQTSSVSNYMFVTPFLTSLFGFVFAKEKPDLPTLVGGAVILTGMLIFNFGGKLYDLIFHKKSGM
jgi:drug/metabolite transporter (DMT)-like permease